MTSAAIDSAAKGLCPVTASEMESVSGGWYACFFIGLVKQAQIEAQEQKVMDFLGSNVSPKT